MTILETKTLGPKILNAAASRNQTPVTRKVRRTPIASMTGPATTTAMADVAR